MTKASFLTFFTILFANLYSQHLTISNSGDVGPTSGTNWSITGNTLNIASSGSAHINTSVITNHLTNIGDLTIVLPHNGVNSRDLYLNNSITYTGSSARTLTFNITNDIIFASNVGISSSNASLNLVFRTALTLTNIDHGRIALNQSTLNTNGGHLWMGGGSGITTWNGLTVGNSMARTWADNLAGISIINSTINTNGGHIYMYGRSHNTTDDFGSSNFGVNIENSSISSTSGSITIGGDVLGRFTHGVGTTINSYTSATTISTTSGSINILGVGSDQATNGNGWRLGTNIGGSSSTIKTIISSVSGNIQIEGNANFAATINDKEGIVIGGFTEIISRSGNISLKGTNALETSGQYCNSIRFAASNVSNSIRVGFDGTNSYTGNILIEGNSIYQRDQHAGSGSISIQTTGNLTIQPTGNAFTFMRAGNSGTLTFDNDWNFGTNLGGFVYGKTTNTSALTYNNSLRTNGPMTFYTGSTQLGVGVEMTADGANGHINFLSSNGFGTVANSGSTRGKIMATGGGSINVNADYDNNNSGILDIDWLTIDGTSGNVLLEAASFIWNTASQVALPEFYSNGGALTIRNTTSSNYDINTIWFAMFGNFGGVTLGREGGTGAISLNSCTNCSSSALNFGTSAFQVAGPINALGGNIYANINLRSTNSGSDILLKADKHIVVGANVGVQSNNGDITFWSNSNGVADATDGDFIGIQNAVVINSADGSTTQTTGGGTITLAGGTTTQTLASGTIVPTGYAYSNRTTNWGPLLPPGGVNFGFSTAANGQVNSLSIFSGGGNIVIKGKSHSSSAGIQWFSGSAGATQIINSGVGTILFDGLATSTNAHGIEFMSYASVVSPTIISSNTSSSAIRIIGETFSTNLRSGYQGTVRLEAKGIGGGIEVNGKVGSSSNYAAIEAGTLNAYALSGPITFISEGGLGLKAGGTWGKGTLASSSSNITLRSDNISLYTATIEATGTLTVEPLGTSFASALTFPITNLTVGNTVSGLTLGKSTNTANITLANTTTIAGPITAYGGDIAVNENLNTSAGASAGSVLLKGSGDVTLAATKSITTSGAPVILWANSDNGSTNGSIALRNGSSIITGSNSVLGGHIWLGGGSDGITWNGLSVGSGYAVPGTSFTPSNGGGALSSAGIYLERNSITSFGGNIKIAGDASASGYVAIATYGNTITINAGSGKIEMDGQVTSSAAGNRMGILFGFHDNTVISTVNISSSSTSGDAIKITGVGRGTEDAIGLSGTLNIIASGGGNIVMNGNAMGTGRSIVAGNYYHGIMNVLANSGNITLNGNTKAVQVAIPVIGGLTSGPSKINIGQGGTITSSSSDVFLTADNIALAAGGIGIISTGKVTIEPFSNSFTNALTFPITSLSLANTVSGLTLGKSTNTANVTFGATTNIAGPITVYGGNIFAQQNLTSSLSGAAILLQATGYIDVSANRTIQTNNGNITLRSNSGGTAVVLPNSTTGAITLNSGSSLLSTGGNITLGGNFTGTQGAGLYAASARVNGSPGILIDNATLTAAGGNINIYGRCSTSYDDGIRLQANINTTGSGIIGIYGDAFGGLTSGTPNIWFGGITFITNSSTVETENGNINIEGVLTNTQSNGTYALNFFRSAFTSGAQDRHIQIISKTGDIQITADRGTTGAGGMGHSSWGHIYFGSPHSGSWTATGDVKFSYSSFVGAGFFGYKVKTTGAVTYEPTASSFVNAETFPHNANYTVAESASSLTIGKITNTANITMNAATTVAGPISVYGGNIDINNNLTSTANNAKILIKASGQINTNNTRTFQTNNGDFILWSDADNSNGGRIWLGLNNTINTANGSISNGLSGGGKIVLAGGLDNGANGGTANDDIPDGFASNNSSIGVYLGNTSSNYTQMYSGGGDILIKGASTFASATNDGTGLWSDGRWLANSGKGAISIQGTSTHFFGINFSAPLNNISSGNKHIEFVSDKSTGNAVEVTGSSNASYGVVFNYENPKEVLATGGGAITITGTGGGALQGIFLQNTDILSTSGNITMNGGSNGIRVASSGVRIGSRSSSAITSSTSNIKWTANSIDLINLSSGFSNNFSTSGNVTIEPFSNSFTNAISYPITNLSVANTVSGLTLGKSTNSTNITFGATTNIAGPITAFGGTIAVNENMTSSNGSTISLFGNSLTFATGKTVTSNNGQLIIAPQSASNTIGLGGATGTLSLPASYFSTNFSDGFSNIQIGSNTQSGNIAANTFTLRDNMTFLTSGSLSLGGKPVLGNNNITLGDAISSITASASNYFQTNGTGKVISTLANNAARLFPVGNAFYNGVTITNKTNDNDTFSVLIKDSVLGNGDTGRQITTPHVKATWDISKNNANGGNGVDFDFNWNASQEEGGISTFVLNHHNDTVWQIASGTAGSVSGTTTKTMSHTGYMGRFSPFAFGPGVTPLPVELSKFKATCQSDYIQIDWTTASEIRNKAFELYKSDNAQDWKFIHTEAGQGEKATETIYTFKDLDKKTSYYRLKDIDEDGIENWSQIIFSDCKNDVSDIQVYPNPASDYIKVIAPILENTTLNIINLEGKIIKTMPLISNQNVVSVKELTNGIYIINITNNNRSKNIKLLKK